MPNFEADSIIANKALVQTRVSQTLVASGAVTIDASGGNTQIIVLGATTPFNATSSSITNPATGQKLTLRWVQGSTGGATYVWPTNWLWPTGSAPTAITTASQWQSATATYDGTNWNVEDLGGTAVGPAGPAGNGAPTGAAGGSLSGTYPNPSIANLVIVDGMVNAAAAIAESKLSLASDAVAATPSRRSLGTGTQQAQPGSAGQLLGWTHYFPTGGGVTYNISNTAFALVDATNLVLPITTPANGKILLRYNAAIYGASATKGLLYFSPWIGGAQVVNANGNAVACLAGAVDNSIAPNTRASVAFVLDNLAANTALTIQWAASSSSATNFGKIASWVGGFGALIMEAWSLP